MSQELIILIGLQASGKSSFYRRRFSHSHELISKDRMKNRRNKAKRQEMLLERSLASGRSLVLDNTNPTRDDRLNIIQIGKKYRARIIAYYFVPDLQANLCRNRKRIGRERVPDIAIYSVAKKLQEPSYLEGFDEIWRVELGTQEEPFTPSKKSQ
jgi:predicted kinase